MTWNIQNLMRYSGAVLAICILLLASLPQTLFAQSSLALTVTPPLFQLSLARGDVWTSTLKVVNTNSYPLDLYGMVMNVAAQGEKGRSSFSPLSDSGVDGATLGEWITISAAPVTVPSGGSGLFPFTIEVPEDAAPGGYYAAILVGREPDKTTEGEGPVINVSTYISSLLFVRIKGEVIEEGLIRQFTTDKSFYQTPEANFELRFENTGTVHVQPQGTVTIYNMWGKERGQVAINHKTNFGNVLPRSTRAFEFAWKGESHLFEIGRYSAIATLTYGEDGRKNVSAVAYFWVVPVVPLATVLGGTLLIIVLVIWFIRRYIKRALALESARLGMPIHERAYAEERVAPLPFDAPPPPPRRLPNPAEHQMSQPQPVRSVHISVPTLARPITQGVVDLRSISWGGQAGEVPIAEPVEVPQHVMYPPHVPQGHPAPLTPPQFFKRYRLFFMFLIFCAVALMVAARFFGAVLMPERHFDIEVPKEDQGIVTAEEE